MDARVTGGVVLSGVSVERSGVPVIVDVDLSIPAGGWFGLIGANGSGKTSLLRALAGRLPFSGGQCLIGGKDYGEDRASRAHLVGFAPPADRLPDSLRLRDLLQLVGGDVDGARARIGPVYDALGIHPLLDKWIGDCSAGMRQRASIALAFAGGHSLLILDEPLNWLDPVAAFDLRHALRKRLEDGLTLITALHDLGTLASACDEGAMLAAGRVALAMDRAALAEAARAPQEFERKTIDLLRSSPGVGNAR